MESRDPLDDLITETLRDRLGPPPSSEVWQRIAREIAPPRRPSLWKRLRTGWAAPLLQSAAMIASLGLLIIQPALYWQHQPRPTGPASLHVSSYSRPLPDGDLRADSLTLTAHATDPSDALPPRLTAQ